MHATQFSCLNICIKNPKNMEMLQYEAYQWDIISMLMHQNHYFHIPQNYVHWRETPHSHIYSANLPGVRKEEIKVEVEDSTYLIIRTETSDESDEPTKRFMRKFRLPRRVDIEGISAGYEDGVLRVTVPRMSFFTNLAVLAPRMDITASAA